MTKLKALAIGTVAILVVLGALNVLLIVAVTSALPRSDSSEPGGSDPGVIRPESPGTVNSDIEPSDAATADIPPTMLRAYRSTAGVCPGLPWTVIAGIGKVESNHARHGGARLDDDLFVRPPIIGIPLDGRPGVATIPDTDNGELDQDPEWDRAVGPFQFIPSTWGLFEAAAGGPRNPHYLPDGLEAVVWHLCPNGELDDIEAALLGYNRSQAYVDKVLRWADVYDTATAVSPIIDHALPVANVTRGPGPDQTTITGPGTWPPAPPVDGSGGGGRQVADDVVAATEYRARPPRM